MFISLLLSYEKQSNFKNEQNLTNKKRLQMKMIEQYDVASVTSLRRIILEDGLESTKSSYQGALELCS